jgi:hypothetical protein
MIAHGKRHRLGARAAVVAAGLAVLASVALARDARA